MDEIQLQLDRLQNLEEKIDHIAKLENYAIEDDRLVDQIQFKEIRQNLEKRFEKETRELHQVAQVI